MKKFGEKKVGIAIIGCGAISAYHVDALRLIPEAKIVVCCDLIRERAQKTAAGTADVTIDYTEAVDRSDVDLVFNKRDAALYQKFYGTEPDGCIPIATPVPEIDAEKASAGVAGSVKELLFVGSKYFPNILGIRWFYENVLPELPESIAVKIVGRGTEFLREEFADPSIQVIGTVDSVDPYYRNADIVFAPLFDGGGMKCKSVEALSYGKIFVGTSESLYGFWEQMDEELRFKYVYLCDTQVEWVKTMRKLCSEKELHKYNEPVFRLFLNKFSDEATKKQFLSFFEK